MVIKYVHVNLVARNWQRLAAFYEDALGCRRILPERDLAGESIERGTGVSGAHIRGVHLLLPGYDENGPTLELFQYSEIQDSPQPVANRPGFGHLAFAVEDVSAARAAIIARGGSVLGSIESVNVPEAGVITWTYVRDPEGNIIELQHRTGL